MTHSLTGVVPGILDAHIHQWDPPTTPHGQAQLARIYRMSPKVIDLMIRTVIPRSTRDFVRTPEHVLQPFVPETYAADVAPMADAVGVGVDGVIHVQADWDGAGPFGAVEETRWVDALPFGVDGRPALRGIIGMADPRDDHIADVLAAHAEASPRFRGIRLAGAWHPDRKVYRSADREGILRSPEFLRGFAAVAERDLTFDAYVYSHQLDDVAVLAAEYPETPIVLDHYAPLVGWAGRMGDQGKTPTERVTIFDAWRDAISRLAEHPNVVAKHSGLAFPMHGLPSVPYTRGGLAEIVAPLVEHTTDTFGPDRLIFGSNFPMDKALATYPVIVGALLDLLAARGPDVLSKVFRENAERIYRL